MTVSTLNYTELKTPPTTVNENHTHPKSVNISAAKERKVKPIKAAIAARSLPIETFGGSRTRKLVFVTLALYANADGTNCFPKEATVAAESGIKERQLRNHLRWLEENGLIEIQYKGGKPSFRHPNLYTLHFTPDAQAAARERYATKPQTEHRAGINKKTGKANIGTTRSYRKDPDTAISGTDSEGGHGNNHCRVDTAIPDTPHGNLVQPTRQSGEGYTAIASAVFTSSTVSKSPSLSSPPIQPSPTNQNLDGWDGRIHQNSIDEKQKRELNQIKQQLQTLYRKAESKVLEFKSSDDSKLLKAIALVESTTLVPTEAIPLAFRYFLERAETLEGLLYPLLMFLDHLKEYLELAKSDPEAYVLEIEDLGVE